MSSGKGWLYGLVTAMILFILFFVYIVTTIYKSDYSLVSQDSYEQGLKHDEIQEAKKRAEKLGANFEYFGGNNVLKLQFPSNFDKAKVDGKVHFYRPSTASLDFDINLNLTESNAQFFNLEKLEKGFWKVKFNFNYNDKAYYQEYSFSR